MRYNVVSLGNPDEFELPDEIKWHIPNTLTGYNNVVSVVNSREYNDMEFSPIITKYDLNDKLLLMMRGLSNRSISNIPVSDSNIDSELFTSNHLVIHKYSPTFIEISRLVRINTGQQLMGTLIRSHLHFGISGLYYTMNNCSFDVVFNNNNYIELMSNKVASDLWYDSVELLGADEPNRIIGFDRLLNIVRENYP